MAAMNVFITSLTLNIYHIFTKENPQARKSIKKEITNQLINKCMYR